ncbi:MAG: HpcH/HpaI aldolase/citrate lyase family protein [Pseudomonadota bacterium]
MNKNSAPLWLRLGASMYVPSIHADIINIARGEKYPNLRSVIFCTEDAIHELDVEQGLDNINKLLYFKPDNALLRFVRVRNIEVLKKILHYKDIENLTGIVIPKVTANNIGDYLDLLKPFSLQIMLTLETIEAFDALAMQKLRNILLHSEMRDRILMLRIGGNDLLSILQMKRPAHKTAYQTILRPIIEQLVLTFKPYGFHLSAPVYEYISDVELLAQETQEDLSHGLFGKTVIHPSQINIVEAHYRVTENELTMAEKILEKDQPAVFKMHDSMCEVATHQYWAQQIIDRAAVYGVAG